MGSSYNPDKNGEGSYTSPDAIPATVARHEQNRLRSSGPAVLAKWANGTITNPSEYTVFFGDDYESVSTFMSRFEHFEPYAFYAWQQALIWAQAKETDDYIANDQRDIDFGDCSDELSRMRDRIIAYSHIVHPNITQPFSMTGENFCRDGSDVENVTDLLPWLDTTKEEEVPYGRRLNLDEAFQEVRTAIHDYLTATLMSRRAEDLESMETK